MFFYQLFIALLGFGVRVSALFNSKNALWVKGRKNWKKRIISKKHEFSNVIWIHTASLGEFEQGRPLIDALYDKYPNHKILVTFFSPSGYVPKQSYSKAHFVEYLPLDTISNMRFFVETVQPKLVVFVKYEFWFNLLRTLQEKDIPHVFVSAIFRKDHTYFKWYAKGLLTILKKVNRYFVQNEESLKILESHGIKQSEVAGDTRFDSVLSNSKETKTFNELNILNDNYPTIVAGSTWPDDEDLLIQYIKTNKKVNIVIAPHEIKPDKIEHLIKKIGEEVALFSKHPDQQPSRILIIDQIGVLKYLYKYAHMAYIGGGFTKSGIHNTLEPAIFKIPIVFGPNFRKFEEAKELIQLKAGISISNIEELQQAFSLINNAEHLNQVHSTLDKYIQRNLGATVQIMNVLEKQLH